MKTTIFVVDQNRESLHTYEAEVIPAVGDSIQLIRNRVQVFLVVMKRQWEVYDQDTHGTPHSAVHAVLTCSVEDRHFVSHVFPGPVADTLANRLDAHAKGDTLAMDGWDGDPQELEDEMVGRWYAMDSQGG